MQEILDSRRCDEPHIYRGEEAIQKIALQVHYVDFKTGLPLSFAARNDAALCFSF
ncbi:MAG: hypothetical protein Q8K37_05325 [Alphaproteobacteria bacterium]|nr:hypothetical protein [Alphaproteobacteria bacterium]